MCQVRSTPCNSGMPKTQWHASKICQLRRRSPGQFYRLSFITTTQFLTSMAIACIPVTSKLSSRPSPPRPHTTWTQTASQPPNTTDPHSLSSLLDTAKSFLLKFNIQNLCHTLRFSVFRVQTTSDRLSTIMLVVDAVVTSFSSSF
jgi:hypothetical protein